MPVIESNNFERKHLEFVENECTIQGTNLKYTRYNILYNGKPFYIKTPPDLVSYGMKENKRNKDGEDYSFSLELNDTPHERTPFMLYLDEITSAIKVGLERILQKEIPFKLPCKIPGRHFIEFEQPCDIFAAVNANVSMRNVDINNRRHVISSNALGGRSNSKVLNQNNVLSTYF